MPVDASIPLQVQQPNFGNPLQMAQQAMSIKDLMQRSQLQNLQIQQQQQNMANQMLEAKLAAVPGNRDSSGNWTDQGFTQMAAAAPLLVQSERQKQAEREQKLSLMASENATTAIKQLEFRDNTLKEARREVLASVAGQPDPETAFDQAWKAKSKELASGGAFGKAPIPQYNFASASKLEALNTGAVDKVEQVERAAANLSRLQAARDKLAKDSNGLDPRIASMDAQIKAGKAMIGHETGEGQEETAFIKNQDKRDQKTAEYDAMKDKASPAAIRLKNDIRELNDQLKKENHYGPGGPGGSGVGIGGPATKTSAGEYSNPWSAPMGAKLTPEAQYTLDTASLEHMFDGKLPFGKGKYSVPLTERLQANDTRLAMSLNMTPMDVANLPAERKAVVKSLVNQRGTMDAMESTFNSLENNLDTWETLAKGTNTAGVLAGLKKFNYTGIRTLDEFKSRAAREFNDPTSIAIANSAMAVAMDVARLNQGPMSNASLTEGTMEHAMDLVSKSSSPEGIKGARVAIEQDSVGRMKAKRDQMSKTQYELQNPGKMYKPPEDDKKPSAPAAGKSRDFSNLWN